MILGGGTGSTVAAWTFAAEGQRVAVIERRYIGGSCPNIACLPSKNIIHSAKIVRRSEEFGVPKKEFTVDMHAVRERKRSMVSGWNAVYLDNYKKSGAEFIRGGDVSLATGPALFAAKPGWQLLLRRCDLLSSPLWRAPLRPRL